MAASGVSGVSGVRIDNMAGHSSSAVSTNSASYANTANSAMAPRVAFFTDSFHEVNGVAHTSRQFEAFARRRNLPFLCVRAGNRTPALIEEGNVWTLELPRGLFSIPLEKDLYLDPVYLRHMPFIRRVMRRFGPDLVHITGPSEIGIFGAWMAAQMQLPLVASWHTNVHEYAGRRLRNLPWLPPGLSAAAASQIEKNVLRATAWFYSHARTLFAPNPDLCALLERATGRPCHLMPRGVDADLFHPHKRNRAPGDGELVLGYVGRLSVEKNVALLVRIQNELIQNQQKFRFLIVGHGSEEEFLRQRLPRAEFTGVLRGEALAAAYANMDLFVFPSHTDTFGNVVLEALASGVPAIVTPNGGPCTIVRNGETGRIASDENFSSAIADILSNPARHAAMRLAAREYALSTGWDSIFEGIYARYNDLLPARNHEMRVSEDEAIPQEG